MNFLEPWYGTNKSELLVELAREVSPGHVLHQTKLEVLARRQDRDDVLFGFCDGSGCVAQVHLTFAAEVNPRFPLTTVFPNLESWLVVMQADHAEYIA